MASGGGSESASKFVGIMNRSFPCGSVFGIPLRIHVLLPIMLLVICVLDIIRGDWQQLGLNFLIFGPILFGTVLIHELGHCYAARRVTGGHVDHILLWPLGGLAYVGHAGTPQDDLKVAVAGPLTHIPMGLFWLLLWLAFTAGNLLLASGNFFVMLTRDATFLNVALFCFNLLLPAYPLDGGRVFISILLIFHVSITTTAIATLCVSTLLAILVVIYFVLIKHWLGVLVGCWILLQNVYLAMYVKDGRVEEHPLFARQEQQTTNGQDNMSVPMQRV